jgi:hypothetical protein
MNKGYAKGDFMEKSDRVAELVYCDHFVGVRSHRWTFKSWCNNESNRLPSLRLNIRLHMSYFTHAGYYSMDIIIT